MKSALAFDVDSRKELFCKIIESLHFFPNPECWDMSWGEPFLAVSQDRRVWVRVFYEESLPISTERLKREAERLKPHISERGELLFCIPQSWEINYQDLTFQVPFALRVWGYSGSQETSVLSREIVKEKTPGVRVLAPADTAVSHLPAERLSADEVRELTEMGIAFKRHALRAS